MVGEISHATMRGNTAIAISQRRAAASGSDSTRQITAPSMTAASTTAGNMLRQAMREDPDNPRSVCDAVCHSSRWRRVNSIRQSVRTIASAETHAWCGRKMTVSAICWMLVIASRPTAV
jgi:hypothetical protein